MEFNTTSALIPAFISAGIGFGLAFYIERKISSRSPKKSQKILVSIAMTSFGYGLTAFLNELIGFPLQGLHIRYDKLVSHLLGNIIIIPIFFLLISKLIGKNTKPADFEFEAHSNTAKESSLKYFFILAGVVLIIYFWYSAFEGKSSGVTYDFYSRVDYKDCNSTFKEKPYASAKFHFKKETNEIFMTGEREDDGVKKKIIEKLDNCSVLDEKNWTCGGELIGSYKSTTYMFIDGALEIYEGHILESKNCPVKFLKR